MSVRGYPFEADAILDDGRLVKHCKHKQAHTVGHLDPAVWLWPSAVMHTCDGCCIGWDKMQEDHQWENWQNPANTARSEADWRRDVIARNASTVPR